MSEILYKLSSTFSFFYKIYVFSTVSLLFCSTYGTGTPILKLQSADADTDLYSLLSSVYYTLVRIMRPDSTPQNPINIKITYVTPPIHFTLCEYVNM
jgi:hypothetical protein